jgi:hypothetical protein
MELFIYNHLEELQEYTYPINCQEGKGFYTHLLYFIHCIWHGSAFFSLPVYFLIMF